MKTEDRVNCAFFFYRVIDRETDREIGNQLSWLALLASVQQSPKQLDDFRW